MKLAEDPISIGLVIASVGLLGLYFHENRKLAELDEAEIRAQAIDLGPLGDASCEAHAAGFEGQVLTIRCQNRADFQTIAKSVSDAGTRAGFSTLSVLGTEDRVTCELPVAAGGGCKSVVSQ